MFTPNASKHGHQSPTPNPLYAALIAEHSTDTKTNAFSACKKTPKEQTAQVAATLPFTPNAQ